MGRHFVWVLGFGLFFGGICSSPAQVRIKDIARVELTGQDYSSSSYLGRNPSVALAVFQRVEHVGNEMRDLLRFEFHHAGQLGAEITHQHGMTTRGRFGQHFVAKFVFLFAFGLTIADEFAEERRHGADTEFARRIRRLYQGRNRQMGRGGAHGQHQGRIRTIARPRPRR